MQAQKDLLLQRSANLYRLGIDVEAARKRLKNLIEAGYSYHSEQVIAALQSFQKLDARWKTLERQYLDLRNAIQAEK